jgi:hypothetical protein
VKKLFIIIFILLSLAPTVASAAICQDSIGSTKLCDPTTVGSLPEFGFFVAKTFGVLLGWTVIVMVMFAGFRMIMAQGNEEEVSKAKSALQWTLSGFVLALFAYLIVYATNAFLGGKKEFQQGSIDAGDVNPLEKYKTFGDLLQGMIQGFLGLAALIAILMIIINGFRYITARGNEEVVGKAKEGILWSVLGLVIVLLAYVLTVATAKLFGATVTN